MADGIHYAHSLPNAPSTTWQPLDAHLRGVAGLAAQFAAAFGTEDWGRAAGWFHDLGKYSAAFQRYLRQAGTDDCHGEDSGERTDHSTAGAQHAVTVRRARHEVGRLRKVACLVRPGATHFVSIHVRRRPPTLASVWQTARTDVVSFRQMVLSGSSPYSFNLF